MACVQGSAVRILLALILGLLVVSGYVVAPILFAKAGSSHEAGRLAGEIFHVVNNGVVIIAVAVAAFWLRMKSISRRSWGMLLVVASLAAINEYGVSPIIAELKLAAGPIDQLAADDPLKAQFGMWHGVSAVIHLLSSIMAVILLLTGVHGRADNGSKESCKES
ncbi:MAG TPA: DUF4149 domain-containing protein [Mariprofundaceae bacterium]|nr:DUF4149 domain-containing protein [Mariprofundaceae bacterium]